MMAAAAHALRLDYLVMTVAAFMLTLATVAFSRSNTLQRT